MEDKGEDKASKLETIKFRANLFLGSLCFFCIFGFLLLIPFVLEPALSTIYHQFVEEPVHCKVTDYNLGIGLDDCSWSSCREGCTAKQFRCHKIRVVYSREIYQDPENLQDIHSWVDITSRENKVTFADTPLLVNIKGCGYPPAIICDEFAEKINNYSQAGLTIPCHYSKRDPRIVISSYNYNDNMTGILCSIFIPNTILIGAILLLVYWSCQ